MVLPDYQADCCPSLQTRPSASILFMRLGHSLTVNSAPLPFTTSEASYIVVHLPSEIWGSQEETHRYPQRSDYRAPGNIQDHSRHPNQEMLSGAPTVHSGCFKSSECPSSTSGHQEAPPDLQTPRLPSSAWYRPMPPVSMCLQGNFCVAISAIFNTQPGLWGCLLGGPARAPCLTI